MCSETKVQQLIENHIDFANTMAKTLARKKGLTGIEEQDLHSAAVLGLCEAAHRYESGKGAGFKTFAYFRIYGAMIDLAKDTNGISRYSFKKLQAAEKEESIDGEPADCPETTEATFATVPQDLISFISSIDNLSYTGARSSGHEAKVDLVYRNAPNPEEEAARQSTSRFLKKLIKQLEVDQRSMIEGRYFQEKNLRLVKVYIFIFSL